MANHFLLYQRPLSHDEQENILGIAGLLPEYIIGSAYRGELDVVNAVGRCTVEVIDSYLPVGARVRMDNVRRKVAVQWDAFRDELPVNKLVPNGGFEDGDDGVWSKQQGWSIGQHDSYNVESGLWSAKFSDFKTKGSSIHMARVPAKVNDSITFNARIQQGASSKGNAGARCHLRFLDANNVELSAPSGPMVSSGSGGEWKNSGNTASAPANTAWVEVWIAAYRNKQNKPLFVDTVTWNHAYRWGQDTFDDYWVRLRVTDGLNRTVDWFGYIYYRSNVARSQRYPVVAVDDIGIDVEFLSASTYVGMLSHTVEAELAVLDVEFMSAGTRSYQFDTAVQLESAELDVVFVSAGTKSTQVIHNQQPETMQLTVELVSVGSKQVLFDHKVAFDAVSLDVSFIGAGTQ